MRIPRIDRVRIFFQLQRSILFKYGWIQSWRTNRPVDRDREPIPWMTYPAIDFLGQFDYSEASILEWGSGYSTLWWAKRCKSITSIESQVDWIPYIKTMIPDNVRLLTPEFDKESEVNVIDEENFVYDIIVIDNHGPFRASCAEKAVSILADGGLIVLDNSDQCLKATAVLRAAGFTQIDFTGLVPTMGYAHSTSIFLKQRIALPSLHADLPAQSVAQPNPPWENC